METYPDSLHIIMYYDSEAASKDGFGWCVEFSDAETTNRFGTLAGAIAYINLFADLLKNSKTVKYPL